ncbi:MAG: hypothetical protein HOY71_26610 [Nonomuraea sp.]|nr:hypothetical protein [Nonomuraea sp.]
MSLDGDEHAHDRHRRFANGRGSHAQVSQSLRRLTDGPYHLGADFEHTRKGTGRVGKAEARLFPLVEAVDFAVSWFSANRSAHAQGQDEVDAFVPGVQ